MTSACRGLAGKAGAEGFEYRDRARPVLERHEQRARVELRRLADRGAGREPAHAQVIVHGAGGIARGLLRLALLVDRGRKALVDRRRLRILGREQRLHLQVGAFGVGKAPGVELRVAGDRPGRALHGGVDRRPAREHESRDFERFRQVLEVVVLARSARQKRRALRVRGEGNRKALLAFEALAVPRGRRCAIRGLCLALVAHERGVTRLRRLVVERIGVCRALVLGRRRAEFPALEQRLGEQVVGLCRLRVVREGLQELAVPARRLVVVRLLLRALRLGVVVLREVGQVRLQLAGDQRKLLGRAAGPERAAELVALDEFLLPVEHELREAALLVGLDRLHLQERRALVVRIAVDERPVAVRRVREALLADVEVAELRIEHEGVRDLAPRGHEVVERLLAFHVGEGDRQHSEGVLHELPICARKCRRIHDAACLRGIDQLEVEHAHEGIERRLVLGLLEQRPAELVEALLVELALRAECARGLVGLLCLWIALGAEQDFAAAELRLVESRARGIRSPPACPGTRAPCPPRRAIPSRARAGRARRRRAHSPAAARAGGCRSRSPRASRPRPVPPSRHARCRPPRSAGRRAAAWPRCEARDRRPRARGSGGTVPWRGPGPARRSRRRVSPGQPASGP